MVMEKDQIVVKLRDLMKRSSQANVKWELINEQSTIESIGFDSLSILDLIYDLQQEFGVEFDAEELATTKTVGQLVAFLQTKGI
jgi:acyl carrier protein